MSVTEYGVRFLKFGFSYVGRIYLVMLMLPNIICHIVYVYMHLES